MFSMLISEQICADVGAVNFSASRESFKKMLIDIRKNEFMFGLFLVEIRRLLEAGELS